MTEADLDLSYTALCEALAQVGPQRAELFLSMVALGLIARQEQAGEVLALVERVRDRCLSEDAESGEGAHDS